MSTQIPICPIMSSGQEYKSVCAQETCAWYIKNYKTCGIYLLAHDAAMNIKEKLNQMKTSQ